MIAPEQVNRPDIRKEMESVFREYEAALMNNDLDALDRMFWHSELVVRFGADETLYGIEAIRAFRLDRDTGALQRSLNATRITTYGSDFATTTTEFVRADGLRGRQSQTWVRFADGWRVVAAHISLLATAAR